MRSSLFDCFARRIVRKPVLIAFFSRCMSAGTNPSAVGGGNYLAIFHSLTWRKRCNSPKRQRNAQQLYWEPETPQPTLVTKQESHITVREKTYTVLFLYLKKTHTRFLIRPPKHIRVFSPVQKHIRVFDFKFETHTRFRFRFEKHIRVFFLQ